MGDRQNASAEGFTLVELIVVVAIIALLASLLLPGLARAKDLAKTTSCKNNLRQLGIALNLYTLDHERFPGNGAVYGVNLPGSPRRFNSFVYRGLNWLYPYLNGKHKTNYLAIYHSYTPDDVPPPVLLCPGEKPDSNGWTLREGKAFDHIQPGYAYNEIGTGLWFNHRTLGLGPIADDKIGPMSHRDFVWRYIAPHEVISPSRMIALADSNRYALPYSWLTPFKKGQKLSTLEGPHKKGKLANVVFVDGHVEAGKNEAWVAKTDEARARWNNDALPHRESWENY
jgi:prepilin-type N-terminal cleavage/methylation domain-containing protein/prepilin-type processing-associated H-X9-DG protein